MRVLLVLSLLLFYVECEPKFFKNYHATGSISLPYAEIKEPFEIWYSESLNKSRIDYYGGVVSNIADVAGAAAFKVAYFSNQTAGVLNKRTCFKTGQGADVQIQGVVPETSGMAKIGTGIANGLMCDIWAMALNSSTHINQKYMLYVYGDQIPVQFVMEGFNIISGSHVDKYVIDYITFTPADAIPGAKFTEPTIGLECGDFPGPGDNEDVFSELAGGYVHHQDKWEDFKGTYSKKYRSKEEHADRFAAYANNIRFIASKNRQGLSYILAANHMADWLPHENEKLRGKIYTGVKNNGGTFTKEGMLFGELPVNFDLRVEGAVGPVKDQAICGSCWSFATTGSIEGAYYKKYGYRISVSEQNLMDCSWGHGNNGCDGGEEWRAYDWVMEMGGLSYEEEYGQYKMADGKCHTTDKTVNIESYTNVKDEDSLKLALFNKGAVAVNIDASHASLRFYQSGVYEEPDCKQGAADLDHAVLAVGWGTLGGKDYWIIKNSWSTYWGNVGYVLMDRKDNMCGVTTDGTFVTVA